MFDVVEQSPGLSLIDSYEKPVYRPPGLFEFPDGRWRLVYILGGATTREDVGETVVRMATCTTPACAQVEIVQLLSLAPYVMLAGEQAEIPYSDMDMGDVPEDLIKAVLAAAKEK